MDDNYLINLTPYEELEQGDKSMNDSVDDTFEIPDKVLLYLQGGKEYVMSPGIYMHPFRPEMHLAGPYIYTDGKYIWDRDTWKYVKKYHLRLPDEFIEYVMAKDVDEFINERESWNDKFKAKGAISFIPEDDGDVNLEDF